MERNHNKILAVEQQFQQKLLEEREKYKNDVFKIQGNYYYLKIRTEKYTRSKNKQVV